jgi:hypothetical protein
MPQQSSNTTYCRSSQKTKSLSYECKPSNTTSFPSLGSPAQMVEAPVFHPTEREFQDPLEYIDRIRPVAEKFGLCRVVPPPNFKVGVHNSMINFSYLFDKMLTSVLLLTALFQRWDVSLPFLLVTFHL